MDWVTGILPADTAHARATTTRPAAACTQTTGQGDIGGWAARHSRASSALIGLKSASEASVASSANPFGALAGSGAIVTMANYVQFTSGNDCKAPDYRGLSVVGGRLSYKRAAARRAARERPRARQ